MCRSRSLFCRTRDRTFCTLICGAIGLGLLIVAPATAIAQEVDGDSLAVVGCWTVEPGEWRPLLETKDPAVRLPERMRLDPGPYRGGEGIFHGRTLPDRHVEVMDRRPGDLRWPGPGRRLADGIWRAAGDSTRVTFSTGFTGYVLTVAPADPEPATLRGRVQSFIDVLDDRPAPAAGVVLRRIACEPPSAEPAEISPPTLEPAGCDSDLDGALYGTLAGAAPGLLWVITSPEGEARLVPTIAMMGGAFIGFWAGLAIDSIGCEEWEPE